MDAPIEKLSSSKYWESMQRLELQFRYMRWALKEMPAKLKKKFFIEEGKERSKLVDGIRERFPAEFPQFESIGPQLFKTWKQMERKKFSPSNLHHYEQFLADNLNQSELLLLVAAFETFMKEIHRSLLAAAPEKVFGNPKSDRTVLLRDVFKPGFRFLEQSEFMRGLIEQEIRRVDRESLEIRADYFKKKFGIDWAVDLKRLAPIYAKRHAISHRFKDDNPDVTVSVQDLKDGRALLSGIPCRCIAAAATLYPSHFR